MLPGMQLVEEGCPRTAVYGGCDALLSGNGRVWEVKDPHVIGGKRIEAWTPRCMGIVNGVVPVNMIR